MVIKSGVRVVGADKPENFGQDALDQEYFLMQNPHGDYEGLAKVYDVHRATQERDAGDFPAIRSADDAARLENRIAELAAEGRLVNAQGEPVDPSKVFVTRVIGAEEYNSDMRRMLSDHGLSFEDTKDLNARDLEVLADSAREGALNQAELKTLHADMTDENGIASVEYDSENPVAGLNAATLGDDTDRYSWTIHEGEMAGLGDRHARLSMDDADRLTNIRDGLNSAGMTVLEGQNADTETPLLLIPGDDLDNSEVDLGYAKAHMDSLEVDTPDVEPMGQAPAVEAKLSVPEI